LALAELTRAMRSISGGPAKLPGTTWVEWVNNLREHIASDEGNNTGAKIAFDNKRQNDLYRCAKILSTTGRKRRAVSDEALEPFIERYNGRLMSVENSTLLLHILLFKPPSL
jgi:hypothetical protein